MLAYLRGEPAAGRRAAGGGASWVRKAKRVNPSGAIYRSLRNARVRLDTTGMQGLVDCLGARRPGWASTSLDWARAQVVPPLIDGSPPPQPKKTNSPLNPYLREHT